MPAKLFSPALAISDLHGVWPICGNVNDENRRSTHHVAVWRVKLPYLLSSAETIHDSVQQRCPAVLALDVGAL